MLSGWPESIYLPKRCRWWAKRVDRMGRWVELHQHPMKVKNNQTFCTFSHRLSFGHKILPKNPSSTSRLSVAMLLSDSVEQQPPQFSNGVKVADYPPFPTFITYSRKGFFCPAYWFNGNEFLVLLNQVKVTVTYWGGPFTKSSVVVDGAGWMKVVLYSVWLSHPFWGASKSFVGFLNAFLVVFFFERIPLPLLLLTNAGYHIKGAFMYFLLGRGMWLSSCFNEAPSVSSRSPTDRHIINGARSSTTTSA